MPRESDMRPTVDTWLRDQGITPVHECLLCHPVDVLGIRFKPQEGRTIPAIYRLVAVELKLDDVAGVLRQARSNRHYVNFSYAAMPAERCARMKDATLDRFRAAGIGLLAIDIGLSPINGGVKQKVLAGCNDLKVWDHHRKQHWRRYQRALKLERNG